MVSLQTIFILGLVLAHLGLYILAQLYWRSREAALRVTILSSATVVLGLLGYRWHGLAGAILLPLIVHLFFWASLVLISQTLLPLADWPFRRRAVQVFASYVFGMRIPSYVVDNCRVLERVQGHHKGRSGAGVILVGPGNAVVLQTETDFSRVIGPGVNFLHPSERIRTVVDLRTQERGASITARTRDAVPVRVPITCTFRIAPRRRSVASVGSVSFSTQAIRTLVYNQQGVDENNEPYSWDDHVLQVVISRFQEILSGYTLDQLFEPNSPDQVPRLMLRSSLSAVTRNDLRKLGIELLSADLGTFEFIGPGKEAVFQQRIASWQAEWDARVEGKMAEGAAEAERVVQTARASAEWELIQGLVNGLSAAQNLAGIEPADLVTWQLLNTMETMSADPLIQPMIPQETVNALFSIRSWLEDAES